MRRVSPRGRRQSWSFQPHWLRVVVDDGEDGNGGVRRRSHGRSLVIGAYPAPEERRQLSESLGRALAMLSLEMLSRPCGPGPMPAT